MLICEKNGGKIMKEYLEFKNELLENYNLDCNKCKRLKDTIMDLEYENDELIETCDEKSLVIDDLLEKINELEKRNDILLKAFKVVVQLLENNV